MAEKYRFFDPVQDSNGQYDREYNAQEFTDYFGALITTGIMKGTLNELKVTTNGNSMVTTVDTGIAFLEGRYYENDSPLDLVHDTESLGKSRIDRIVIRLDLRTEARYVRAFVKKGIQSENPIPPALQRDDNIYEISLAQVKIIGGQTYINADDVIDERGKEDICPWASSKILPSFNDNALAQHIENMTNHIKYAVDSGTANEKIITLEQDLKEYIDGMGIAFKNAVQNTGAVTININNLGAKPILRPNGNQLSSGALKAGSIYTIRYNEDDGNFILQGEGGEYGTAKPEHVLVGYTIGTDDGIKQGTMINRSGTTTSGSRVASGNGYVDIIPPTGYYDGANNSRVRLSDSNFNANNIKGGVSIFGITGTASPNYYSVRTNVSVHQTLQSVTIPVPCSFIPKYWICEVQGAKLNNGYYNFFGNIYKTPYWIQDSAAPYLVMYYRNGYTSYGTPMYECGAVFWEGNSYVSGTTLNYVLRLYESSSFNNNWGLDTQSLSVRIHIWG